MLMQWFCLFSTLALASNDDTEQPIHIEADSAKIDEQQGVMTYSGHVLLHQGGIEVRAETVVVYSKDGELQRITAQGDPVRYQQQRRNEEAVKGVSQRMEYNATSKQVLLLGKAEFWQGGNRFSGNRIQYDPETESVVANAGSDAADATGAEKQRRVTVTLQPRKADKKP
jgi:lipopolysaccharide export system protein LptA